MVTKYMLPAFVYISILYVAALGISGADLRAKNVSGFLSAFGACPRDRSSPVGPFMLLDRGRR